MCTCPGVVDESPEMARALKLAANKALSALNMTAVGEVELAAVEPGEPLTLPARLCQQVFSFLNHTLYITLLHLFLYNNNVIPNKHTPGVTRKVYLPNFILLEY